MFINVVYKDAPELSTTCRRLSTEPDPSQEKTLLVNPDCPVRVMLEYIRKQCKLGLFTTFDLCDDGGTLLDLFSLETYAYATDRFEHKRTYYVIVLKTEADRRLSILPQLNQENKFYYELKQRVKSYMAIKVSPSASKNSKNNTPSAANTRSTPTPPPTRTKSLLAGKKK